MPRGEQVRGERARSPQRGRSPQPAGGPRRPLRLPLPPPGASFLHSFCRSIELWKIRPSPASFELLQDILGQGKQLVRDFRAPLTLTFGDSFFRQQTLLQAFPALGVFSPVPRSPLCPPPFPSPLSAPSFGDRGSAPKGGRTPQYFLILSETLLVKCPSVQWQPDVLTIRTKQVDPRSQIPRSTSHFSYSCVTHSLCTIQPNT